MAKPIQYSRTHGVCIAMGESYPGEAEYHKQMQDNSIGAEPPGGPPKRYCDEPTRTTARPWAETDQRKPYLPTEDTSTPSLEDGVSFRQSF
jgi:hypothetical protein